MSDQWPGLRVMTYSQDGLGLGHMRRTSSIGTELLRVRPDVTLLGIADSPVAHWFDSTPHHDHIKLPSVVKLGPGDWRPLRLPMAWDEVKRMREDIIRSTMLRFRPDILLVDHMPHGAMGELVPALDALRAAGGPTKVVLGLRDILDAPEVIRLRWSVEGAYTVLDEYYDVVLVYGSRDLFDVVESYGFPSQVSAKVRYCGYVCTADAPKYARRVRAEITGGDLRRKVIVAMAGGGADAYPMMKAVIEAVSTFEADAAAPSVVVIAGPFMPQDLRRDLQARAVGLPIRVRPSVSDPLSYIEAADLVVAMAGYNTTIETLRSATPAILIPRRGPSAEQRMRAGLFASRGWVSVVDPEKATPRTLARAMRRGLAPRPRRAPIPELDGARRAAQHLLSLVDTGPAHRAVSPAR
jgi:predicted glycosyltransferase